jgi:hypothetical protein
MGFSDENDYEQQANEQQEYEYCVDILKAVRYDLSLDQFAYVAGKLGIDQREVRNEYY